MTDRYIGEIVQVKGYGGAAKIVAMEEDGITPQGHPRYLCSVVFGPYSPNEKYYASKPNPRTKYYGVGQTLKHKQGTVHQFYAGRLQPFGTVEEQLDNKIDQMDQAAILARLAAINAELAKTEA
jgi:hypothetical protein